MQVERKSKKVIEKNSGKIRRANLSENRNNVVVQMAIKLSVTVTK